MNGDLLNFVTPESASAAGGLLGLLASKREADVSKLLSNILVGSGLGYALGQYSPEFGSLYSSITNKDFGALTEDPLKTSMLVGLITGAAGYLASLPDENKSTLVETAKSGALGMVLGALVPHLINNILENN